MYSMIWDQVDDDVHVNKDYLTGFTHDIYTVVCVYIFMKWILLFFFWFIVGQNKGNY